MFEIYERELAYMMTHNGDELRRMPKLYFRGAKILDDVVQCHMVGKVVLNLD